MPFPGSTLRAPLLWLLLPFMAGIAAGSHWPGLSSGWLSILLAFSLGTAGLAYVAVSRSPLFWAGAIILSVALCGYATVRLRQPDEPGAAQAPRESTLVLEVDRLYPSSPGKKTRSGLGMVVSTEGTSGLKTGDRLYFSALKRGGVPLENSGQYLLKGVLQPLPPSADGAGFAAYLQELGVRHALTRAHVRRETQPPGWYHRQADRARGCLDRLLALGLERHPAELALYRGMLLGEKAVLSADQERQFTHSGTFHIFVIAGLHIGVIATAIHSLLLLLRIPHRPALLLGLVILGLYVMVTGAGLPARRAFVMICLFTVSRVGRLPSNSLAILTAAALGVLLLEPAELFGTGFQMSFAVVAGLICVGGPLAQRLQAAWNPWALLPPADHRWWQRAVTRLGRETVGGLAISGTALVASAVPIIASFGIFSPVSLLANLVVVPLAMLAISAGCAALGTGLLQLESLTRLFNHAAVLLIKVMEWLVRLGNDLPGASFPAHFRTPGLVAPALALVVAALLLAGARTWPPRARAYLWPPLALGLVLIFCVKFG